MSENNDLASLLQESIRASNRTTHAVRAFVRFLFIQLSFVTAAFLTWQVALAFPDEENCTPMGCAPSVFWNYLIGALLIIGVWLSSRAGWSELEKSEVPTRAFYLGKSRE
jgi:hypothetical protein